MSNLGFESLSRSRAAYRGDDLVDVRFSVLAATATLAVAILAAVKGAPVAAAIWTLLAVGFVVRAVFGYRRR
jgi:hypothetical protein